MVSTEFDGVEVEAILSKLVLLQNAVDLLPERLSLLVEPGISKRSRLTDEGMSSKDVLSDVQSYQPGNNGRVLSPEAQIQRLTGQLTAAYNRIAALEEQLLSKRSFVQESQRLSGVQDL